MPTAPRVRCPQCKTLHAGTGKCADCRTTQRRASDRQRGSGSARGWSSEWQQFRVRYLAQHPQCVTCGAKATDIDHIDGCGRSGARAYDLSNLRAMCHSCHSKRTARDQPGGWHKGSLNTP